MRFRKPNSDNSKPAFPGEKSAADGHTSTCAAEAMASEAILVQSNADFAEDLVKKLAANTSTCMVREVGDARTIAAMAAA